jgi:hypothetical protein
MADIIYTRAFWEMALALKTQDDQDCEACHVGTIRKGEGKRTVRVVLTGDGEPVPERLRLLCTICYPDRTAIHLSRKQILDRIALLPFENPEAPKSANA